MRILAFALAMIFASAAADAAPWIVQRSNGLVSITGAGAQPISLGASEISNGATVTTGKTGRVLLSRGEELMAIGPNSVVRIPGDNIFGFTKIMQTAGAVTFDVEKRKVRHFSVATPYMAAVVKGTRFTVTVTATGAKVSVNRGLVGVRNFSNGQSIDVAPGQTAGVVAGGKTVLSGQGVGHRPDPAFRASGDNKSKGKIASSSSPGKSGSSHAGGNGNSGHENGGNGNSGSGNGN